MKTPRRVIVNTGAKNEADDQFAIVNALLSPTFNIRGLIAAHFGTERTNHRSNRSMLEARDEIDLLLKLIDLEAEVTYLVVGSAWGMGVRTPSRCDALAA